MYQGFAVWDDSLALGHDLIDAQHQQIVDMFNDLYEARHFGRSDTVLYDVIRRMMGYVRDHFSTEEGLMSAGGCPNLESHRSEHAFFVAEAERLQSSSGEIDVDELLTFLKNWLLEHIGKTDRECLAYMKK